MEDVMGIEEIIKKQREKILKLAEKHGAKNIRVFGSVARNEAHPKSDVDFLVDVAPHHSSFFPAGLMVDLSDLLGRPVDVVTERALHWYIKDRILKEARPL